MSLNDEHKLDSNQPRLSIIAAIGKNRELGKNNELIWRISSDLKRVKALTMGHPIIMGRKTHESIGRPLPGRTNIVITSRAEEIPGCLVVPSLEKALEAARALDAEEIFIFGGAQVYNAALPHASRLYLTVINATDAGADVYFPPYQNEFTNVIEKIASTEGTLAYEWLTLERP